MSIELMSIEQMESVIGEYAASVKEVIGKPSRKNYSQTPECIEYIWQTNDKCFELFVWDDGDVDIIISNYKAADLHEGVNMYECVDKNRSFNLAKIYKYI